MAILKQSETTFTDDHGKILHISNRKSAIILYMDESQDDREHMIRYFFSPDTFKQIYDHLVAVSATSWKAVVPKEVTSASNDYSEYYDTQLDNNGYLWLEDNLLSLERPTSRSLKLYQFNITKIQTFLYDYAKLVK